MIRELVSGNTRVHGNTWSWGTLGTLDRVKIQYSCN